MKYGERKDKESIFFKETGTFLHRKRLFSSGKSPAFLPTVARYGKKGPAAVWNRLACFLKTPCLFSEKDAGLFLRTGRTFSIRWQNLWKKTFALAGKDLYLPSQTTAPRYERAGHGRRKIMFKFKKGDNRKWQQCTSRQMQNAPVA
jgi:hypothetical protein